MTKSGSKSATKGCGSDSASESKKKITYEEYILRLKKKTGDGFVESSSAKSSPRSASRRPPMSSYDKGDFKKSKKKMKDEFLNKKSRKDSKR